MHLTITPESSLKSIQDAFIEQYPFLKIESLKSVNKGESMKSEKPGSEKKIFLFSQDLKILKISLDHNVTVSQLELAFKEMLSLTVKVYRKAGTVWVETQHTEHWTLEQQNNEGKQFSTSETYIE